MKTIFEAVYSATVFTDYYQLNPLQHPLNQISTQSLALQDKTHYFCRLNIKNSKFDMELKNYETVFILTPLLNEVQMQETVEKFRQVLKENGADIIHEENWGLRKLAYPIQKKSTGFYHLIEFKAPGTIVDPLELAYRRDEKVVRFLTTALDKHAVAYNERRRKGEFKSQAKKEEVKA